LKSIPVALLIRVFYSLPPNGDIFITESEADSIKVLRDTGSNTPPLVETFADRGMKDPFGIAFYPPGPEPEFLYVANSNQVVRFPYRNGDLNARGPVGKTQRRTFRGRVAPWWWDTGHVTSFFRLTGRRCMFR
jgi:glucose/arabinose dehydrogenase